jgi:hypothetical protein
MLMILIAVATVGAVTYLWVTRGFMSSLIHMLCVIAAGAIAFGVWEPASMFLLNAAPDRGFGSFLSDIAWGLGLALPFAASLALLRVGVDALLPFNAQCDSVVDYIGGGVCGFVAGVISAGIMVLSIGFLRVSPDFWGHSPLEYTTQSSRGSLERPAGSFVPWVDRITASLYSHLSLTTLRTSTPMATWHPEFDTYPGALRQTYEGKSRTTLKPKDFDVIGWYNLGDAQRPADLKALLVDHWNDVAQSVTDINGERISTGYMTGLIVQFRSGARERGGFIVAGNGQLRLVVESETGSGDARAIHPVAVITRTADPTKIDYARFRFDSDGMFVSSVGGEADAIMAFEFPVPQGYRPLAMYIKGVRYSLADRKAGKVFESPRVRDEALRTGKFEGMANAGMPILDAEGRPIVRADPSGFDQWKPALVQVTPALGFIIQKGTERSLSVSQAGRAWQVDSGEAKFTRDELERTRGIDNKIQINRFNIDETTAMVKVDISPGQRPSEFSRVIETAERDVPPELIDTNGRRFQAVGFVYDDGNLIHLRYTRGQPIRGLAELPSVSRNTPERKLTLLFIVSRGVEIKEFRVGRSLVEEYKETIKTDIGGR